MDHISTQAVYIYLSNLFNVPCVQNQNQSVHRLVPAKVLYRLGGEVGGGVGLISKSFFCAVNITDMYIQISQP